MKMERISSRENLLHGYAALKAFEIPSSIPKSPFRSSDVDFNDVFGGPPRRFSLHETRSSSDGPIESEETVLFRSLNGEKRVFGEESSVNRRKNGQSNDFFDDIFGGDKSYSSPRRDFMNSFPGSRVMSPSRPLAPKSEPFGTSLPAQFSFVLHPVTPFGLFSLPATLTKAMDCPTFGSSSSFKKKEGTASGISTPSSSLSRFSSQTMQVQDDFRSDVWPSNGPSPLSNEFHLRNEELSYAAKSNETNMRRNLRDNSNNIEAPTNVNEFHFSIYKWASSGVPIAMPLRKRISSKLKEKEKLVRCSSSKGRIQSDTVCELLPANACSTYTRSISVKSEFSKKKCEKLVNTITLKGAETSLEEVVVKPEANILETTQVTVENFPNCNMLSNKSEETKPNSLPEKSFSERTDKVFTVIEEARKPMLKTLRSILRDEIDGQENEDIVMKAEGKENVAKTTIVSHSNVDASKDVKKRDGKIINSNRTEMNKASIQGSPKSPGGNIKRSGVGGKVKDFVKIFNQETSSKTKSNACIQNQSCRWERKVSGAKVNEASISTIEMDSEVHLPNVNKSPDVSFVEDENVEKLEKHHAHINSTIHTSIDNSSNPKETSPFSFQSQMKSAINTSNDNSDQKEASPFSESIPEGSKVTRENIDDPFQFNYLIQELPDDQIKLSQTSEDHEAIKALDAKILKWSSGKKGNIRSLLSTLQYVLWEASGWKQEPLVNIIEGNAVKRAYQKALLCLHPDKLQQKGAVSHQKYTAEKVFDILQEAWDQFSLLGSI